MTKNEFIKSIATNAKQVCSERGYGYAQYATCIAQACCESGYGKSSLMDKAKAYFGIKATKAWLNKGGKIYNAKTKECYDGKTYTTITDSFRAYNSLADSVRDYFDLLSGKRYAQSLKASTVKECITIIKNGGYATSPTYIDTIMKFYNSDKALIDEIYYVTQTTQAKKSIEEVAREVIRGWYEENGVRKSWGNGAQRQLLLQRDGYNYAEVQAMVNKLLK